MSEFSQYVKEIFQLFGPVSSRRMFGGEGLYHEGLMFGLIAADALYLKADDQSRQHFLDQGLEPFTYVRQGKSVALSYYQAPEELFDDPEVAAEWAQRAFASARRSKSNIASHKNNRSSAKA